VAEDVVDRDRGDSAPEVLTSPALARDLRDPAAARRRRLVQRGAAAVLVAGCLVAGFVVTTGGDAPAPPGAVPPASPALAPEVTAPQGVTPVRVPANLLTGRLGGEWRTRELTRRDVADGLREHGVTGAAFVRALPSDPFRIRLSVYAGRASARVDHSLLDAAFLVRGRGSRVEMRDMRSGRPTWYTVRRDGDRLRFAWRDSGPGHWHGFPAEVQRALYTTAPFSPLGRRR
jgi:hypothetical protein